jgi:hypothetical protein
MKELLLTQLVTILVQMLTPQTLRRLADSLLDIAEAAVESSENKYDDIIVLSVCRAIRTAFDIIDEDSDAASQEKLNF